MTGVSLIAEEPVPAVVETSQGVTQEIVAVIEAAAAQFLGRPVRILSVRMVEEPSEDSNAWGSQGRDIIQTSHNLVQRGH